MFGADGGPAQPFRTVRFDYFLVEPAVAMPRCSLADSRASMRRNCGGPELRAAGPIVFSEEE